jgi:hypothetical protein
LRIQFTADGCLSDAEINENIRLSKLRGLPHIKGAGRLALVGGGPSAMNRIPELTIWDGPVWAINGAAKWCYCIGVRATLVTLHPFVEIPDCVEHFVFGEECSPALFDAARGRDVSILSDKSHSGQSVPRGGTTATAVAIMAPLLGFEDVTFFGLEGSYGDRTHNYDVYQDPDEEWVIVETDGKTFRTKAEFLLQSQILAELVHAFPIYEERSGGLLRALVNDHLYEVIDAAPDVLRRIEEEAIKHGYQLSDYRPQPAA